MKNWLTQGLSLCALAALSLTACKKDEVRATLTPSNAPTLAASTNTVVLSQANSAQTAITYTWTPVTSFAWTGAEHSYTPAVTYNIQLDKKGNNFASPVTIAAGAGPTTAVTVGDLNASLITLGVTPGTATALESRINASYATNSPLVSPTVALTATAYKVCVAPNSDKWSIIGPAGVDWNTDVALTYNCDTKTYDYVGKLNAGDFKFRLNNDWGTNYGSSTSTGGALVSNGSNITVATAGTYTIKLDLASKVYSIK
ncbi:SusF/SusE family outer membrane protein [Hymenobacter sp. HMF4947]|uniref:SusF/SusE family outer membrane protein n=1 Tax=Hymenobacter ginkgonis TaxID=2682976 RepID=A0A7K1TA41_9BACT|nr:SusE domain-containing protein [Hymenobacter ginkgonis]MVN75276.1 SusF/SusE family outer membrane protein [Hymenobacter ginkgonis]